MFKDWAKTPPLGWNSWDCFGAAVNEKELLENANYMAENLREFGWEYIICDIQWYEPKAKSNDYNNFTELTIDEYGRLLPAENRFPSSKGGKGFKEIADYCHSLGLKFGIHIMRGIPRIAVHNNMKIKNSKFTCREIAHHFSVCSWNTDMYGTKTCKGAQDYYNSIFELYASWGVDFVKCDDICVTEFRLFDEPYSAREEIEMIRKAIDNCGRKIVLSLSPGPALIEEKAHLSKNANMWRMTGDFWDEWDKLYKMFDRCEIWQGVGKSGNWPDCDMLPIGVLAKNASCHGDANRKTNFTKAEQYTLMSLWGIFKSPLFIGGNLPENDEFTDSLLKNKEYMKMHQTSFGAEEILREEKNNKGTIIWQALGMGCKYLAIFNTKDKKASISFDFNKILMPNEKYKGFDIWESKSIGILKNKIKTEVEPHGAKLYKITPAK